MESIRVELPTGAWWDIKAELTRADRRFIDREVETMAFDTMSRLEQSGMSMEKLQDITSAASAPTRGRRPTAILLARRQETSDTTPNPVLIRSYKFV